MAGDTLDQLPRWARELLEQERVGHLGLLCARGRPRVLPITYALCEGSLWSIVDNKPKRRDREPARLRWLRERPAAAVTVDRYEDDWSQLAWVQLLGDVEILEALAAPAAVAALTDRYPRYAEDPPPGPLVRLRPHRALWWRATDH